MESRIALKFSPEGSKLAYLRRGGNLWVADADGKNPKLVIESWDAPSYDWSPDGKWLVYAIDDSDFNRDIWIKPIDRSRHPLMSHATHSMKMTPSGLPMAGRLLSSASGKEGRNRHFFRLSRAEDDEKGSRDRTIKRHSRRSRKVARQWV